MNYAYVRVSTDKQDQENQRHEIEKYCRAHGLVIDQWCEETVSGTKDYSKRKLGPLLEDMQPGDLLVCSEISRLGRTLYMIFDVLRLMTEREIQLTTIKDNFHLTSDIQSKVLAFAFGLSAEIERNLISQRTKEALDRKRKEGVHIGRFKGSKNKIVKLTSKEPAIRILIGEGCNRSQIARLLHVDRTTLTRYIAERMPDVQVACGLNKLTEADEESLRESVRDMGA